MNYTWLIIWLVLFVILIIIEMITTAVTAIWIGAGCVAGAVAAAFGVPVWLQIIIVAATSFICFAFIRPGVKHSFDKKKRLSALKDFIGTRALVTSEIDNIRGIGEVRIGRHEYAARCSESGYAIPEGTVVEIIDVHRDIMLVRVDNTIGYNMEVKSSEARLDPHIYDDF